MLPDTLTPTLRKRRLFLQKMYYKKKGQLAHAYASKDPVRIREGKLSLARILLEVHGSPELGKPRPFRWGRQLSLLLSYGADNEIPWSEAQSAGWYEAANLLISSCELVTALPDTQALSDPAPTSPVSDLRQLHRVLQAFNSPTSRIASELC